MIVIKRLIKNIIFYAFFPLTFLVFFVSAVIARYLKKQYDIGIGPEPLINNVHHKDALILYGYSVQTFVNQVYYITNKFDIRGDMWALRIRNYLLFMHVLFSYKIIYIYFNGGPLGWTKLAMFESMFLKIARVKVVVMPYGGDVYKSSENYNLLLKNAYLRDYPNLVKYSEEKNKWQVNYWIKNADHIISGCDWVYYLKYWDTLMTAHFSINIEKWQSSKEYILPIKFDINRKLKILHAPNHKNGKGTEFFVKAINELINEGCHIDFVLLGGLSNDQLKEVVDSVDLICDQLIIGWHGIFALEAMAMNKPVICYIEKQLEELYIATNLIKKDEIPLINANIFDVKEKILYYYNNPHKLEDLSNRSREYVIEHHSIEYIGNIFNEINKRLI